MFNALPTHDLTIALIGKLHAPGIAQTLNELMGFITDAKHQVVLEEETAKILNTCTSPIWGVTQIGQEAHVAIVVGGDGTMLGIARQLAPYRVPVIGINQGRLGFMTDISLTEMTHVLGKILSGQYEIEERSLLQATVVRDEQIIAHALALNDVVVARGAVSGMVELSVDVDGRFMYRQRSDGLIVTTPTGSTAYSLSANGPILHPHLGGLALVPIAPHALSNRPIVLPDSSKIAITVIDGKEISVNFDMQSFTALGYGDCVRIERAPTPIRFLHPAGYSYFATLRQKLHWNTHPNAIGNH